MTTSPRSPAAEHDLVEDLLRPEAWAERVPGAGRVELGETHVSWLFFVGERVYKVKKPVDLGFLDFTTLERREHFCREEVRLNARLSPRMYLGVAPLTRAADGRLRVGGSGPPAEWAVEMLRLPARDMLDAILDRGELDNKLMNTLVARLVRFHHEARTGPGVDEHGSPEAVRANVEENFRQLREVPPRGDDVDAETWDACLAFLEERQLAFLDEHRELLERRVRRGRIREGHGDLHAGNICVSRRGLFIYDCIEFNERFRCLDVACDLAFLAMDLDHHDAPAFSNYLVHRYAREAGDAAVEELMDFYKEYRALVRCKVAALTAADAGLDAAAAARKREEAVRLLNLAVSYELPPAMVLLCGLPASGKSWLGKRLAHTLRGVHLQSDVRRKILAGIVPTASGRCAVDAGLYAPEMKDRTYRFLLEHAVEILQAGRTVFVDATFAKEEFRRPFVDAATRLGIPLYLVHVTASEEVTRARLAAREADPRETSDANLEVWQRARATFEPPDELPPGTVLELDSATTPPHRAAATLLTRMIAGGARRDPA